MKIRTQRRDGERCGVQGGKEEGGGEGYREGNGKEKEGGGGVKGRSQIWYICIDVKRESWKNNLEPFLIIVETLMEA